MPTFLIVGAMRSGTSSLVHYLRRHPDIFISQPKELHFFDHHYERGVDWYEQQFSGAQDKVQVGEATPNYMYDRIAVDRMVHLLPDVKLIAILRNPVARAYSHYWHNRSRGKESLDFVEALQAEPARLALSAESATTFSYADRGRYDRQLRYLLDRFPRQALKVLLFEDLESDPDDVVTEACGHLNLAPLPNTFAGVVVNEYTEFRSLTLRRLAKRLPSPMARLAAGINVRRGRGYIPLSPDIRRRLELLYRDEIELASELTGRDLAKIWFQTQCSKEA
ncbi:MAG TPA: sulfotransferase [Acidimicrobiia bacterium]|nr:sulfotransferase [Acidimicrobiia bacterium]